MSLEVQHHIIATEVESHSLIDWIGNLKEFQLDTFFGSRVLGKAYDYIETVNEINNQQLEIEATVGASMYSTAIMLSEGTVSISCSCPFDSACKHSAALLLRKMKIELH